MDKQTDQTDQTDPPKRRAELAPTPTSQEVFGRRLPQRYEDLPPTSAEMMEATNRLVTQENTLRERLRVARDNRRKGLPAPAVGAKLYVSLDRAIDARRRAGVRFERGHRSTIEVIDATDEEVIAIQEKNVFPKGVDGVVNVWGAEQILEDDALLVHQTAEAVDPQEVKGLRDHNQAVERENAALREEVAKLRQARMAAPPSAHGEPSRLIAAREAASQSSDEFGKEPAASKVVAQPNPTGKNPK